MKNYPSSEDIHVRLDKFLGPYIRGTTWFSKTLNKLYSVHSMQYNSIDWNLVNLCGSTPIGQHHFSTPTAVNLMEWIQ